MERKKRLILDHETRMARELALLVFDKPKPHLWMILLPIFFVFFAQKMKQYTKGLEDFTGNYMTSRRRALDAAFEAEGAGTPVDWNELLEGARIPDEARPLYTEWMGHLIDHYRLLLSSSGSTLAELVRAGYASKTNYLLFCNCLHKAENAFAQALLPAMQGDDGDLRHIIAKMQAAADDLGRRDADTFFP